MEKEKLILVPYPKQVNYKSGFFLLRGGDFLSIPLEDKEQLFFVVKRIQGVIKNLCRLDLPIMIGKQGTVRKAVIFEKDITLSEEGYLLNINPDSIRVGYRNGAGAFHAVSTLKQLIQQCGKILPCLEVIDEPDFKVRSIMLDISRSKIPSMVTLFKIVNLMADLKLNQLQLYIEGFSFAYHSYPEVWKNETPVKGEEIIELDRYCRERFIELLPNQNSFGHMGAWLSRREFNYIAECPQGYTGPDGNNDKPNTLNPLDVKSIELLEKLYDDLLPNFSSELFNVGCDETFELGQGKSKELCEKIGKDRVYLNFLMKVYKLAKRRGKKIMFWADMILKYPELLGELPRDIIALIWGYDAEEPRKEDCEAFEYAGIPFYTCPGTSTWCSIAGRTENMKQNLLNAAINGKRYGAIGYLNTDWGDKGHWQYLPVSYAGFSYGAALSWGVEKNKDMNIPAYIDRFIFQDANNIMGHFVLELGNYYLEENKIIDYMTTIFHILYSKLEDMRFINGFNKQDFDRIKGYIGTLEEELNKAQMQCWDAAIIDAEFRNAIRFIRHGANLGILKLKIGDKHDEKDTRLLLEEMINDITELIKNHKELWLRRNRSGGLEESIQQLESLKKQYYETLAMTEKNIIEN